jgi:hypothetical protein
MRIPLWEWDVVEGTRCGVSRTSYGAMEALSLALITTHDAIGEITPVTLVDAASRPPFYLHGEPKWIAKCHDGVITWRDGTFLLGNDGKCFHAESTQTAGDSGT